MGFDSWGGGMRDRDQRRRNQGICTYSSARVEAAEEAQAQALVAIGEIILELSLASRTGSTED